MRNAITSKSLKIFCIKTRYENFETISRIVGNFQVFTFNWQRNNNKELYSRAESGLAGPGRAWSGLAGPGRAGSLRITIMCSKRNIFIL